MVRILESMSLLLDFSLKSEEDNNLPMRIFLEHPLPNTNELVQTPVLPRPPDGSHTFVNSHRNKYYSLLSLPFFAVNSTFCSLWGGKGRRQSIVL